jgi:hypothetical protein
MAPAPLVSATRIFVRRAGPTLQQLYAWLGVSWHLQFGTPDFIFGSRHSSLGPGDHKIAYTSQFDPSSIGRGWRIPLGLFPPPLRDRVNDLLTKLDYQTLDDVGVARESAETGSGLAHQSPIDGDLASELASSLERAVGLPTSGFIRLVLVDLPGTAWVLDFANRRLFPGDEPRALTIKTTQATLQGIRGGRVNPASAVRAGDLSVQPADHIRMLDREALVDTFCRLFQPLESTVMELAIAD